MTEFIHVVFGNSAAHSLERSFQHNNNLRGEIFCLNDDLTIGPIKELNKIEGINKRADWIKSTQDNLLFHKWINFGSKDSTPIEQIRKHLNFGGNICVWYGKNALDILSLSRLMFEIHPPAKQVFIVPVSESKQVSFRGDEFIPQSLAVLRIEQIAMLDKLIKKATPDFIEDFIKIWEDVSPKAGLLRVLSTSGVVESKEESFFDEILKSNCTLTFRQLARVIGESMADIEQADHATLNWRLKELVKQNQIEGKGTLDNIRDYEVRLIQTT